MNDKPVSSRRQRRSLLLLLGAGAAVAGVVMKSRSHAAAPRALPACVVTPEQMEGPYFVDELLNRADVRSDPVDGSVKPGAPLSLQLSVMLVDGSACQPAPGAMVDIWQCDAAGAYSGAVDPHFNTTGRKFLRGYQMTDAGGTARFVTIYPGWYPGRAVHIHFKVRGRNVAGRAYEFDSQLYFDDALTDRVHAREPYAAHGQRRTRNGADGLFRRGGTHLTLAVTQSETGYASEYTIGVKT